MLEAEIEANFPLDADSGNNLLNLANIIIKVIKPLKVMVDDPTNPTTAIIADQAAKTVFLSNGGELKTKFVKDTMGKLTNYAQAISETVFLGASIDDSFKKYGLVIDGKVDPSGKLSLHSEIILKSLG